MPSPNHFPKIIQLSLHVTCKFVVYTPTNLKVLLKKVQNINTVLSSVVIDVRLSVAGPRCIRWHKNTTNLPWKVFSRELKLLSQSVKQSNLEYGKYSDLADERSSVLSILAISPVQQATRRGFMARNTSDPIYHQNHYYTNSLSNLLSGWEDHE